MMDETPSKKDDRMDLTPSKKDDTMDVVSNEKDSRGNGVRIKIDGRLAEWISHQRKG
jgi:hypothetical protein